MFAIRKRTIAGAAVALLMALNPVSAAQRCIRLEPVTFHGPSELQYLVDGIHEMASASLSEKGMSISKECADQSLAITVTLFGGSASVSATLVGEEGSTPVKVTRSGSEGELFKQVEAVVGIAIADSIVVSEPVAPVIVSPKATEMRTEPVKGVFKTLAMGDVDGDGDAEIIAVSGKSLLVYKVAGKSLIPSGQYDMEGYVRPNRVNLFDMDGDGADEIIVSGVHTATNGSVSRLLSLKTGKLEPIADDAHVFIDVVTPVGAESPVCIGQRLSGIELALPLYLVTLEKGQLETKVAGPSLSGVNAFGWDSSPATKDQAEGVYKLTDAGGLQYWKGGNEHLWSGDAGYGEATAHVSIEEGSKKTEKRRYFLPRVRRVETDTLKGVALTQNETRFGALFQGIKSYKKGRVSVVAWNGYEVKVIAASKSYEGFVPDFAMGDVDGDGKLEAVFPVVSSKRTYFVLSQIEK